MRCKSFGNRNSKDSKYKKKSPSYRFREDLEIFY
nr:MAG TPA: hypothetical protein [Caudoviricetes sp.]